MVQRQIQGLKLGEVVAAAQPKPLQLDLNGDMEEIDPAPLKDAPIGDSYQNPFARLDPFSKGSMTKSQPTDPVEIHGGDKESAGYNKRKWRVEISQAKLQSIEKAREDYNRFLKENNNTSNREVWKVYDHLTADLFNDVLTEVMQTLNKDLDQYCEKVIYDEF